MKNFIFFIFFNIYCKICLAILSLPLLNLPSNNINEKNRNYNNTVSIFDDNLNCKGKTLIFNLILQMF